jgi:AAA family ATP:ADP antiporter
LLKRFKNLLLEILSLGVKTAPDELHGVTGMFFSLFLILMTSYFLKPAREILILTEETAEIRSYAVAMQAVLLIILLPIYGKFSRKFSTANFMRVITILFAIVLVLFYIAADMGYHISVVFFIWLGVYGVIVIAHFWAFATDLFTREAGERLFVIIAFGGSIGAWVGSVISRVLVDYLSAHELILLSSATLALSMIPALYAVKTLPLECRLQEDVSKHEIKTSFMACFQIVLTRRFLLMIAAFVILFNLINSTGEYLLSSTLEREFAAGTMSGKITIEKAVYVGQFYSGFFFMVNLAGVLIQFFLVSRLIRHAGFSWAFALTPLIVFLGYSSLIFIPVLALLRLVKISENSLDYSLLNTTKQMLYLPLNRQEKYEARATIDSFGQRVGDLLQAGVIFLGLNIFNFVYREFIAVVIVLSLCNAFFAYLILRERSRLLK